MFYCLCFYNCPNFLLSPPFSNKPHTSTYKKLKKIRPKKFRLFTKKKSKVGLCEMRSKQNRHNASSQNAY